MEQPLQMRAPANYSRVDLHDPAEAEYWLLVLDATRQQLDTAIAVAGNDVRDVHACLQRLRAGNKTRPELRPDSC